MRNNIPRHARGFSLIELMIVIIVLGITLAWGLPSFMTAMRGNRVVTETNDFLLAINVARSEAIKRNRRVGICPTANGSACTTAWNDGWMVWADLNDNNTFDAANDLVIRRGTADDDIAYATTSATTAIAFNGRGTPIGLAADASFTVQVTGCTAGDKYRRTVVVARRSGQTRVGTTAASKTCA